jgi:pyruvate/2-oxoglutarate dehydrogenase complex dihydrolipoamide dehydrogenase (E3) component
MGRVPNVEGLGLKEAGIEFDTNTGVKINDFMQTTNPYVYAVGDCCTKLQFTHMADAMARAVVKNAYFLGKVRHNELIVPRVTYTEPEVAQVGRNKEECEGAKIPYDEYIHEFGKEESG